MTTRDDRLAQCIAETGLEQRGFRCPDLTPGIGTKHA